MVRKSTKIWTIVSFFVIITLIYGLFRLIYDILPFIGFIENPVLSWLISTLSIILFSLILCIIIGLYTYSCCVTFKIKGPLLSTVATVGALVIYYLAWKLNEITVNTEKETYINLSSIIWVVISFITFFSFLFKSNLALKYLKRLAEFSITFSLIRLLKIVFQHNLNIDSLPNDIIHAKILIFFFQDIVGLIVLFAFSYCIIYILIFREVVLKKYLTNQKRCGRSVLVADSTGFILLGILSCAINFNITLI